MGSAERITSDSSASRAVALKRKAELANKDCLQNMKDSKPAAKKKH